MPTVNFHSIDQNSNTLWDVVPKLDALLSRNVPATHFVEDIDSAFTRHGAKEGGTGLRKERVLRGGESDWGASLFYMEFLGRLPLDIRELEPFTGWTTAALSRRLNSDMDELYEQYSTSDNWQLTGASYVGENHGLHRVIGDLRVAEIADHLRELLSRAESDLLRAFPETAAQARINNWFERERTLVASLLRDHAADTLPQLYKGWLTRRCVRQFPVKFTSEFFRLEQDNPAHRLLSLFISRYEEAAACYNRAIKETGARLRTLKTTEGELPFFALRRLDGSLVRSSLRLDGSSLCHAQGSWPLPASRLPWERMRADGVVSVAGKALLLVIQARCEPGGAALVLPHQGSLYMPTAHALERLLRENGLLPWDRLHSVYRVRFRLFDRMRGCQTIIRLPDYLRQAFTSEEMTAAAFAEELSAQCARIQHTFDRLRLNPAEHDRLMTELWPEDNTRRQSQEARRRELALSPEGRNEATQIRDEIRKLDATLLRRFFDWLVEQRRVLELLYYDSRGALLPWCVALGGEPFYRSLIEQAELYPEPPDQGVAQMK